jgi:hypothetical protein
VKQVLNIDLSGFGESTVNLLFSEKPAVLLQVADAGRVIGDLAERG